MRTILKVLIALFIVLFLGPLGATTSAYAQRGWGRGYSGRGFGGGGFGRGFHGRGRGGMSGGGMYPSRGWGGRGTFAPRGYPYNYGRGYGYYTY